MICGPSPLNGSEAVEAHQSYNNQKPSPNEIHEHPQVTQTSAKLESW